MSVSPSDHRFPSSSRVPSSSFAGNTGSRVTRPGPLTAIRTRRLAGFACAAIVAAGPAEAQTIPRAAFEVLPGPPELERRVWPGDFNRDGHIDLLGSVRFPGAPALDLMLAIGRGDGTFEAARSVGVAAEAMAVADLNRDGRLDAIVMTRNQFHVLPGRGDGTFGALRTFQTAPGDIFLEEATAVVGDFTGDGRLDVGVPYIDGSNSVFRFYPGRGNLTFANPVQVDMPEGVHTAVAGDFNRDGRVDVAAVGFCCALRVLLNLGPGGVATGEYPINTDLSDLETADLNGDGHLDLVLTKFGVGGPPPTGHLSVFLGRGDGTFDPGVDYEARADVNGERALAIGDFTRDGILDVATVNQSAWYDDDFSFQNGDTVTVFAGDGTGALVEPVTFPLGGENGDAHQNRVNFLEAADLDGDGQLDLMTSPAVVFLNRPPVPNRPPTVFLGPDRTHHHEDVISFHAIANDPDGHFLRFEWGSVVPRGPHNHFRGLVEPGVYTVTVTVDDGMGGVATDSVSITVVPSPGARLLTLGGPASAQMMTPGTRFTVSWILREGEPYDRFDLYYSADAGRTWVPVAGCQRLAGTVSSCAWTVPAVETEQALLSLVGIQGANVWTGVSNMFAISSDPSAPPAFQHRDVGAVGAAGDASYDPATGTFTVSGSGADVWGTADEFHFLWRPMFLGEGVEITARVTSIEHVNEWTKVGLMLRTHLGPQAAHASIFVTPTIAKGIAFQFRRIDGEGSFHVAGPRITGPVWLRLTIDRQQRVRAFVRQGDSPWTLVGEDAVAFPDFDNLSVLAGLVVSSHVDGTVATATFDSVTITPMREWQVTDIGAVGLAGTFLATDTGLRMEASGADIWGTADAFRYRFTMRLLDLRTRVAARVLDIENTNPWAKAGVMIRENTSAGSPHVMVIVSPERGVAMQYRAVSNGATANVAIVAGRGPTWVRLTRDGTRFVGEMSEDGALWRVIGEINLPALTGSMLAGVTVTSHNNGTLATATFENVSIDSPPWP